MLLLGTIIVWIALGSVLASIGCYLTAAFSRAPNSRVALGWSRAGRAFFVLAAAAIIGSAVDLGVLLVTHRFDVAYVYEHSARGMAPLYWFPSFWSGQEGSFLLWAFWTSILGTILACKSGSFERRVMPVYSMVLLFLVSLLIIRSPFVPLDLQGGPVPTEGLGLNPNLENPWMVIHPPTLFLGFSSLAVPFSFAVASLLWRDQKNWLRLTMPWALFGLSILGLAMMMGGYWAYEMLGWGGFWGWDPVENGPLIPWLCLIGFVHLAQVQRVRGTLTGGTYAFALLPFVCGLYETFLTRTGILEKFSVHSFSTLGGVGNQVLLYVLLFAVALSIGLLLWRSRDFKSTESVWSEPASREFAYLAAVILLSLCALISTVGMSAPLLTTLGMKLHLATNVSSVKEDFYNQANFPIALLLAVGLGMGPYLAWRGQDQKGANRLIWFYAASVVAAIAFIIAGRLLGSAVSGRYLVAQLVLFTASSFALFANAALLRSLLLGHTRREGAPLRTAGGVVSHMGIAILLLGIVCLVTFVRKDPDVVLVQGQPVQVLNKAYTMTYLGQTGDFKTDKNNALRFKVVSKDGRENFTALLPFALRATEAGNKMIFGHPAIVHHAGGDLYLALKDGPDLFYKISPFNIKIPLGKVGHVGDYAVQFMEFQRDPEAAAFVQQTGQMPDVFPVTALVKVTYHGNTSFVSPKFVMHRDNPQMPDTPEVALPGGWLISFQGMNAGNTGVVNPSPESVRQDGAFELRADSGPPLETFQLEISTRPMIWLIWLGTLLVVIGGLLSMRRRMLENRLALDGPVDKAVKARVDTPGAKRRRRSLEPAAAVSLSTAVNSLPVSGGETERVILERG